MAVTMLCPRVRMRGYEAAGAPTPFLAREFVAQRRRPTRQAVMAAAQWRAVGTVTKRARRFRRSTVEHGLFHARVRRGLTDSLFAAIVAARARW